jgi:hypothetical protein
MITLVKGQLMMGPDVGPRSDAFSLDPKLADGIWTENE